MAHTWRPANKFAGRFADCYYFFHLYEAYNLLYRRTKFFILQGKLTLLEKNRFQDHLYGVSWKRLLACAGYFFFDILLIV